MRLTHLAVLIAVLDTPLAKGQVGYLEPNYIPRADVALGYSLVRGNAPPANCNCFDMNGGFASVGVSVRSWLSGAAEITGGHANNIGPLGQNLTLLTYTAGPRITLRYSRFTPFAQVMLGAAHGSDSYFPRTSTYTTSATSFAYSIGGGLDYKLSPSLALRPVELQYLHTSFPNGTNNSENHLVYGAGIAFRFGSSLWTPEPTRAKSRAHKAKQGAEQVEMAPPLPSPPVAASEPPTPQPLPVSEAAAAPPLAPTPGEFHSSVPDAYFDYNSAVLQPGAEQAVQIASTWLRAHPDLKLQIGGYADERGTQEYNLVLATKRAEVTRDALISTGIDGSRLTVHSYGKLVQTCDGKEESCYRQNRRAAFDMQP